jgi:hypothetical protein
MHSPNYLFAGPMPAGLSQIGDNRRGSQLILQVYTTWEGTVKVLNIVSGGSKAHQKAACACGVSGSQGGRPDGARVKKEQYEELGLMP